MLASAASALTMVAWLGHPPLTLLHLTLLLWQIHKMIKKVKKAEKKKTTMNEACRRTPRHLFCA
jgi:1,4-dihydroxy-2-naphthoate octaprenyltransferase